MGERRGGIPHGARPCRLHERARIARRAAGLEVVYGVEGVSPEQVGSTGRVERIGASPRMSLEGVFAPPGVPDDLACTLPGGAFLATVEERASPEHERTDAVALRARRAHEHAGSGKGEVRRAGRVRPVEADPALVQHAAARSEIGIGPRLRAHALHHLLSAGRRRRERTEVERATPAFAVHRDERPHVERIAHIVDPSEPSHRLSLAVDGNPAATKRQAQSACHAEGARN